MRIKMMQALYKKSPDFNLICADEKLEQTHTTLSPRSRLDCCKIKLRLFWWLFGSYLLAEALFSHFPELDREKGHSGISMCLI